MVNEAKSIMMDIKQYRGDNHYWTGESNEDLILIYNPEGSQLRDIQHRLLEMLLYIRDLCEKHSIDYYLDGGTLLGAVRHSGFIPWDDDLDIVINAKDLKRLKKCIVANPHPHFFLMDKNTEKNYYYGWPRIVDKFSTSKYVGHFLESKNQLKILKHSGVSMDIFIYSDHVIVWINKLLHRIHKLNMKYLITKSKTLADFIWFLLFYLCKPVAKACGAIFANHSIIGHDYLSCNTVHRFRKDKVYPLTTILFEGHLFKAPKDPDYYLRTLYDDYMSLPPEKERHHHGREYTLFSYDLEKFVSV